MDNKDLIEKRKEWFSQMEEKLQEMHTEEDDSLFYYHSSAFPPRPNHPYVQEKEDCCEVLASRSR